MQRAPAAAPPDRSDENGANDTKDLRSVDSIEDILNDLFDCPAATNNISEPVRQTGHDQAHLEPKNFVGSCSRNFKRRIFLNDQ